MRRSILVLAVLAAGAFTQWGHAESDAEVAAHRAALDLAGAFSNDEFKLRDGHFLGTVAPGQPATIQVNLFAGNQYWFSAAATEPAKKISVQVFDEAGKLVTTKPYQEGTQAAAGFSPDVSGPFYIRIEETEGESAPFCFLYSYK